MSARVFSFDSERSLSGASLVGSNGPAIFMNRIHPQPRRVFTLAHEFFHLLVNEGGDRPHVAWANACSAEPGGKPREESLADQFAAEFLMPREAIEERIADDQPRSKSLTGAAVIHLAVSFRCVDPGDVVSPRQSGKTGEERSFGIVRRPERAPAGSGSALGGGASPGRAALIQGIGGVGVPCRPDLPGKARRID